ncbi:hypothetical protein [Klebsiella pneumoniae]|uniref:hypothetical protein n=1 Tax=Klebsiella pneumoniae TaxID=573 RepID=UPI00351E3D92
MSQSCGKWFVSIQTEREVEQPIPQGGAVGIDMGIARFACEVSGEVMSPAAGTHRSDSGTAQCRA